MNTIKYIGFCIALVLFLGTVKTSHSFNMLIMPQNECGTTHVGPQDLVDVTGFPMKAEGVRNIRLDTTTILLRSTLDLPQMPEWLPEVWAKSGIVISTLRIRNETHQKNKMATELQTFLVIEWSEPMTVCDILTGWEAWTLRQIEKPTVLFGEALLVFIHRGERKILRDYLLVTLVPGVHPDTFVREVLTPLERENLKFYQGISLPDQTEGIWKMILRAKETLFPLRAARILSGHRQFVSSVSPIFIPYVSTINTKSFMERIGNDRSSIRFHDGETIYSEQASYDATLQLSITVDLLRNESGKPYFKLLTNASELAKNIEEAIVPKTEGVLRIDPSACWEYRSDDSALQTVQVFFACRFVPSLPGRFEIGSLPLRFEIETGGMPFTMHTERSFVLNTVELRHPEQDGIVSFIGTFSAPQQKIAARDTEETEADRGPIATHMRQKIGGTIKLIMKAVYEGATSFIHAPGAFLRERELFIVMTLGAVSLCAFLVRTYLWGWGIFPSLLETCKLGATFVVRLVVYASIPLMMDRDPSRALRKVIAIIHKGENIENMSIESLALRSGINLDLDQQAFYDWVKLAPRSKLESVFAALWIEEHSSIWKLPLNTVHAYHAHILRPFSLRHFLALPKYLHAATLEYEKREGFTCS
ncbi:MAG: hypothetical protein G01um101448_16 [Parcubacteria group bacterium Gr01-1014_48]|nr:MAG: hypothetical protein Greene041614_378 [Parcubacteria group bacterium Greene0416_14]TSC74601.1 MAG: hypothetical protein G01um101448_16 [Parcubacteria group bacterium Gr01-1014_48]TSD01600.1 MAG: hypothetical protein Greene101415_180 [Parcubacteria group bacterium Greene1014_15]TSD08351.1 MAG: hypothetical protein Greene07144_146 [Parcubacteria group bacterium Greene0714_4]